MSLLVGVALFSLGAVLASFAGLAAARLHTGQTILSGRSRCDACAATLGASSLVPILSYAASGGRAQCCDARLSLRSPLAECALGLSFVLSYGKLGLSLALPFALAALVLLLALVLYDLAHQILPIPLLAPFILASVAAAWLSAPVAFLDSLIAASLVALVFALIHFFSGGRAMGLADAPLAFGLALLAGANAALSGFVFSFWIGAVIGIAILLGRAPGSRMKVEVPFAPFLAAGFLLAYFIPWNPFALVFAAL